MKAVLVTSLLILSANAMAADYEPVNVPDNPSGSDVCRDYIGYHKKIDPDQILPRGTSTADLTYYYEGQIVGTMRSNQDGSETAVCQPL